jgi:flagellar hook-associated protein 3 FlgL
MRISTLTLFDSGAARIGEVQSDLQKTQQQIASGRRIVSPSDDPTAAARALTLTQAQSLNTQYGVNRQSAESTLSLQDGNLSDVTELIQNIQSTIISVGNGSITNANRSAIATTLNANLQSLIGLANATDGQGNYLYSGYQTGTVPFVQSATGATYLGDNGQQLLQVDSTRRIAATTPGSQVFQGGGQDVFQTLTNLVTLLQTPVVTAADQANLSAGLQTATANVTLAQNNISTVRAAIGSRVQELNSLDTAGDSRNTQYSQTLSTLQDLDYTKALTQLTQQQTTLQAAQKSFAQTAGLNLFTYL